MQLLFQTPDDIREESVLAIFLVVEFEDADLVDLFYLFLAGGICVMDR